MLLCLTVRKLEEPKSTIGNSACDKINSFRVKEEKKSYHDKASSEDLKRQLEKIEEKMENIHRAVAISVNHLT